MDTRELLDHQIAYYRARAQEYDEWFLRLGRYDRGPEHRAHWQRDIAQVAEALRVAIHDQQVLEIACGTGQWTRNLAENNARVLAIDSSPETIALNRRKLASDHVDYQVADIFSWTPPPSFDAVFFSFWLSHVPPERFEEFWKIVRAALKPGGQVFFIDSLLEETTSAADQGSPDRSGFSRRKLNDGREFSVVKIYYEPPVLERQLQEMGWQGSVRATSRFFLYGSFTRPA